MWAFLVCDCRCCGDTLDSARKYRTFLFVVWLQKEYQMDLRVINFPDKIFKDYLVRHFDKDGDGEISLTEALSITKILCPQLEIRSLAGIEYLPNLVILDCSRNELESLDVSQNVKLEHLSCYNNPKLDNLDISFNPLLESLYCGNCSLTQLDVHQNKNLSILSCGFNPIERYCSK